MGGGGEGGEGFTWAVGRGLVVGCILLVDGIRDTVGRL